MPTKEVSKHFLKLILDAEVSPDLHLGTRDLYAVPGRSAHEDHSRSGAWQFASGVGNRVVSFLATQSVDEVPRGMSYDLSDDFDTIVRPAADLNAFGSAQDRLTVGGVKMNENVPQFRSGVVSRAGKDNLTSAEKAELRRLIDLVTDVCDAASINFWKAGSTQAGLDLQRLREAHARVDAMVDRIGAILA